MLWAIPWKAVALWRSARNGERFWFFFLLILNTLGILEIIYIFFFSKNKNDNRFKK
jgi:methionyl-tRNA synthetase